MLTNNANKQNISFWNLLNQMESREHGILFCNPKVNTGSMRFIQPILQKFDVKE